MSIPTNNTFHCQSNQQENDEQSINLSIIPLINNNTNDQHLNEMNIQNNQQNGTKNIHIIITFNVSGLHASTKRYRLADWMQK